MSSRALRRAQRELEEKQKLEQLAKSEEDDGDTDEDAVPAPRTQKSAFAMLGEVEDEDEDDEAANPQGDDSDSENHQTVRQEQRPPQSTRPGKKKKKKKNKPKVPAEPEKEDDDLDEIDRALKSLSTTNSKDPATEAASNVTDEHTNEACKLLAVNQQGLHPSNEMRKLFGRAAFDEGDDAPAQAGRGRRAQRAAAQAQMIGIAGAVNRRNTPGGNRGLAALALRRNIFVQGKESWPSGSSGGLSMEIVEKRPDGTVEYAFVHNQSYQAVQEQFHRCVGMMDPERMIALLRENPYHVATLLQVSEIAKQERDHSTSGDLLERALFALGRAVHSSFSKSIAEGKARLDFLREENREFWLAIWRYMNNLVMRGTHKTVYEWAKLLISFSPREDPYGLHLVLDQYALRAREYAHFQSIYEASFSEDSEIKLTPNMCFSAGLALIQTKNLDRARETLRSAIEDFPWLVAKLLNELGIDEVPANIWGQQPNTPYETLIATLYATRAKDLWSNPEATAFLLETCKAANPPAKSEDLGLEIDINIARHVILCDNPTFLALLPRDFTRQVGSANDPLPPPDSLHTYHSNSSRTVLLDGSWGLPDLLTGIQTGPPRLLAALRELIAGRANEDGDVEGSDEMPRLEGEDGWEVDNLLDAIMERAEGAPDPRAVVEGRVQDVDVEDHEESDPPNRQPRVEDADDHEH